jgi:transporter family protein
MHHWLPYAFLALLLWGFWGFFPKLSTKHISPSSALVFEVLGALTVGLVIAASLRFRPEVRAKGVLFAFLTGVAGTLGIFFFLHGVTIGKASVVVTLTALYPVVSLLLVFLFLKEPITAKQGAGILTALVAVVLLSTP